MVNFDDAIKKFAEDGCVVIENFLTLEEIESLRTAAFDLVEHMTPEDHLATFSTDEKSPAHMKHLEYFFDSADKVGFFFEEGVRGPDGKLNIDKHKAINKIAHGLHRLDSFKKICCSDKVQKLLRALNYKQPAIVQSMYIMKNAHVGGKVGEHQDATFLLTEPDTVMGLWFPIDDATVNNGCLWFAPGSHKAGILNGRKWIRQTANATDAASREPSLPQMVFTADAASLPDGDYVPAPVSSGSCVLINGCVMHKSSANTSEQSRHAFTFHLFDKATSSWSENNWLQVDGGNLMNIYSAAS